MQEDLDFVEIDFENVDRELKELSHQQLWGCKATAADGSIWEIIALNQKRDKIYVKWLSGKTKIGELDLENSRVAILSDKDIKKLTKKMPKLEF